MSAFDARNFASPWNAVHAVYAAATCATLPVFAVLSYAQVFVGHNYDVLAKSVFAFPPSRYMVSFWVAKWLLALFKGLMDIQHISNGVSDLFKLGILAIIALRLWYLVSHEAICFAPQGNKRLNEIALLAVVSSLLLFVVVFFRDDYPMNWAVIWLSFVLLYLGKEVLEREANVNPWLMSKSFEERVLGMYCLIRNSEYKDEEKSIFRGFILDYIMNKANMEITRTSLNIINTYKSNNQSIELQKGLLMKIIEMEFDKEISRINSSMVKDEVQYELTVLFKAQYLMEVCKKTKSAMVLLKSLHAKETWLEFYHYMLYKMNEDFKYNMDQKGRELLYLRLMKEHRTLRESLLAECEVAAKLWDYVLTDFPDIGVVEALVVRTIELENSTKEIWRRIESYNLPISSIYKDYILYKELIHGDLANANKLRGIQRELEKNLGSSNSMIALDMDFFQDMSAAVLFVSAEVKNIGTIQKVNCAFTRLLGYLPKMVVDAKMEFLLSRLYRPYNNAYLHGMISVQGNFARSKEILFVKHKSGYVFPVKAKMQQVSLIGQDAQIMIVLNQIKQDKEKTFLVANLAYKVLCIGEGANVNLGLSKKVVKCREVSVNKLCPDLFESDTGMLKKHRVVKDAHYFYPLYNSEELQRYNIVCPSYDKGKSDSRSNLKNLSLNNMLSIDEDNTQTFNVEIMSLQYGASGVIGYSFGFEAQDGFVEENGSESLEDGVSSSKFEFAYSQKYGVFLRDFNKNDPMGKLHESLSDTQRLNLVLEKTADKALTFAKVVTHRMNFIKANLPREQLKDFKPFFSTNYRPVEYGTNIKIRNIDNPAEEIQDLPYALIGEVQGKVADGIGRNAGNQLLKKQEGEARIKETILNREEARRTIMDHYSIPGSLISFFILITLFSVAFVSMGVIGRVFLNRAKMDINIQLNQTTESFKRGLMFIESIQLISFNSYLNA